MGSAGQVGVDGDYNSLRQDLWLATDQAYKSALDYAGAANRDFCAAFRSRRTLRIFPQEKPLVKIDPRAVPDWSNRNWEQEAKQASQVLRAYPDLYSNRITYTLIYETYYIMNTEGTQVRTSRSPGRDRSQHGNAGARWRAHASLLHDLRDRIPWILPSADRSRSAT